MKRHLLVFILALCAFHTHSAWAEMKETTLGKSSITTAQNMCWDSSRTIPLKGKTCKEFTNPQISCFMPTEIEGKLKDQNLNSRQRAANLFSWQEFIALNWPASPKERGMPDVYKQITAQGPRVWETWKETYEVYLPKGEKPLGWNEYAKPPEGCSQKTPAKILSRLQKINDLDDLRLQAAAATGELPATLTDQNGNLARYEIRMNKILFDYIVENRLYNSQIQAETSSVKFPYGSVLIKAAWKEIADKDDENVFYANQSCVCKSKDNSGQPTDCSLKEMGLVGFHIMHKTPSAPEWIWSSFEHVDNVEDKMGRKASFNNPNCSIKECPPNIQTKPGVPNQIVRSNKIPDKDPNCDMADLAVDNVKLLNTETRESLAQTNSRFQYYELLSTQWPLRNSKVSGDKVIDTVFDPRPSILANSTMESFIQESSSCMGCHSISRTLKPDNFVSSDFTFTLNNTMPQIEGAECFKISASESCYTEIVGIIDEPKDKWEKENWDKIQKGRDITLNTYELLGPELVSSKLHCSSCHLDAGGNPNASWWVNMGVKYKTKKDLQDRINQCFDRSMNGIHVCNSEEECNNNPTMDSLITYMEWLTHRWKQRDSATKARAFPKLAVVLEGDPDRGSAIFEQKCSFCHNIDAQGRYQNGKYFRPALVGPNSYDACAGMAKPIVFAEFIKANMPYGSGGLLTDQEAWDIASYIDGQCRPGKGTDRNGNICSLSRMCKDGKPMN